MRLSKDFFITRKDDVNEEDNKISKLLIKSGMIYKNSSGLYTYLPLGLKVLDNITKIIDRECCEHNISKMLLPSLAKKEIFFKSSRDELLSDILYNVKDKNQKSYVLAPTHEELFIDVASTKIKSYKDLHFSLYQISSKFRDESKTNKGILRKKEFLMFDAYSFDADESGLDISYDNMIHVFRKIFKELNLNVIRAVSDPKDMFASLSEEYQIVSDYGEDEIIKCSKCNFLSNINMAEVKTKIKNDKIEYKNKELVQTIDLKTTKEVSNYLGTSEKDVLKSLIYKIDNEYKMIIIEGSSEINEHKLSRIFGTKDISLATIEQLEELGFVNGFIGPIDSTIPVIADFSVANMSNFICGANKKDYHYKNVNIPIDFKVDKYADLKKFDRNCKCPKCSSKVNILKTIEIGNIFKLGSGYSRKLAITYNDEKNEKNFIYMGSYGIGLDRCLFAIAENNHDEKGLIWPINVAPYKVAIVIANTNDKNSKEYAEKLYKKLNSQNITTILDDRKETLGIKFSDIDLMGIPIRITVGKAFKNGEVEIKLRREDLSINVDKNKVFNYLSEYL